MKKSKNNKIMSLMLVSAIIFALFAAMPPTAVAAAEASVGTFAELTDAINNPGASETVITVTQNIALTAEITIPADKKITIKSAGPAFTLSRGNHEFFAVPHNASLTLQDIILDGNRNPGYVILSVTGGEFTMNSGAILKNNENSAVRVSSGTFVMNGGVISDNIALNGGGAYVQSARSAFIMNGGIIRNNHVKNDGGGVRLNNGGTFTMNGGAIENNTAGQNGGGVSVGGNDKINLSGKAVIRNNASAGEPNNVFLDAGAYINVVVDTDPAAAPAFGDFVVCLTKTADDGVVILSGAPAPDMGNYHLYSDIPDTSLYQDNGKLKIIPTDEACMILYYPNGGQGSMFNDGVKRGDYYNIKANEFTRDGYVFAGWNDKADGTGISYEDCETVGSLTYYLTLYAQWESSVKKPVFILDHVDDQAGGQNLAAAEETEPDITPPSSPEEPDEPGASGGMSNFTRVNLYYFGQFTDVDEEEWYGSNKNGVIACAYEYGLMRGSSATAFNPAGSMTVMQAITIAARVHSIYTTGADNLVQGDPWYLVYLDYARGSGIIDDGDFDNYERAATRGEMAYIFARALPQTEFAEQNTVVSLPDVRSGTAYSEYIFMLYRAGILTGSDTLGTFRASSEVTRAEAAAIISRVILPETRVSGKKYSP